MTKRTSEERYNTIIQQHAQRQRARSAEGVQCELSAVLDGLNAWGALEACQQNANSTPHLHGPKSVWRGGSVPTCGAVLWHKSDGFFGYKTLFVLGVWCTQGAGGVTITVGRKTLAYSAATYNPESYHRLLHKDYTIYHADDNAPPADGAQFVYCAAERLSQRKVLAAQLTLLVG